MKIGALDVIKSRIHSLPVYRMYLNQTKVFPFVTDEGGGGDDPSPDPANDYLTFNITSAGTINMNSASNYQYNKNNGGWAACGSTLSVAAGDVVKFKGDCIRYNHIDFTGSTCGFTVTGNIMSIYSTTGDFRTNTTLAVSEAFSNLFKNCTGLTDAGDLVMPATTLTNYCYTSMFEGCSALTTAPNLPATDLSEGSYGSMFKYCDHLNFICCLAVNLGRYSTDSWTRYVAGSGKFVKNPNMSSWTTGIDGIPDGWTIENYDGTNGAGTSGGGSGGSGDDAPSIPEGSMTRDYNLDFSSDFGPRSNPTLVSGWSIAKDGDAYHLINNNTDYQDLTLTISGDKYFGIAIAVESSTGTADTAVVSDYNDLSEVAADWSADYQTRISQGQNIGSFTATLSNPSYKAEHPGVGTYNVYILEFNSDGTATGRYGKSTITFNAVHDEWQNWDANPDYLTFTVVEGGNIVFAADDVSAIKTIYYLKNNDDAWMPFTSSIGAGTTLAVSAGDVIRFVGYNSSYTYNYNVSNYHYSGFGSSTAKFNVSGNIMSLIYGQHITFDTPIVTKGTFAYLFYNGTTVLSTAGLKFPNNVTERCYQYMFYGCSNMTAAPAKLPAMKMADHCYYYMFQGCSKMVNAPELPANELSSSCYYSMFSGCTLLREAPQLPAVTLAYYCYYNMFRDCSSLTKAPDLPALTAAEGCYRDMFYNCTGLTRCPDLPALTLAAGCYTSMFYQCTGLLEGPKFSATTVASNCCETMFYNCNSLRKATLPPALTLAPYCYRQMYQRCSALLESPDLPATDLDDAWNCCDNMFQACTSLQRAGEIHATTLGKNCFLYMYADCSNLTQAMTELPATIALEGSYAYMFTNSGLTESPIIRAIYAEYADGENLQPFEGMFEGSSNLSKVTCLVADNSTGLTPKKFTDWLMGVANQGTIYTHPNADWWTEAEVTLDVVPAGWTVQSYQED